jgi:hypothetical protein
LEHSQIERRIRVVAQPLIRQGEGQAAAYLRQHEERAAQGRLLANILLEVGEPLPKDRKPRSGVSGAEPARLRGLPAIGRNVSGAIPGTDPLRAVLDKERGRVRR